MQWNWRVGWWLDLLSHALKLTFIILEDEVDDEHQGNEDERYEFTEEDIIIEETHREPETKVGLT